MSEKLHRCRCGGEGRIHMHPYVITDGSHEYNEILCFVMCEKCYYQTRPFRVEEEAVKAWNRRVEE